MYFARAHARVCARAYHNAVANRACRQGTGKRAQPPEIARCVCAPLRGESAREGRGQRPFRVPAAGWTRANRCWRWRMAANTALFFIVIFCHIICCSGARWRRRGREPESHPAQCSPTPRLISGRCEPRHPESAPHGEHPPAHLTRPRPCACSSASMILLRILHILMRILHIIYVFFAYLFAYSAYFAY